MLKIKKKSLPLKIICHVDSEKNKKKQKKLFFNVGKMAHLFLKKMT